MSISYTDPEEQGLHQAIGEITRAPTQSLDGGLCQTDGLGVALAPRDR